ncbi:30S ribosomal protein S17 [Patescibacteria group bacterium]|nr:30S ribosomal protein S17 [Patescibacteria group bacterium]MBU4453058.1 30S ribosomal protein S17 [Patescibacteria group bacterium]MCG2687557.1 30S ribosomal protein S17 [Candidatus Parcubacteria bacterium]
MDKKKTQNRRLNGVVVSDKMQKTAVVKVDRTLAHPKYLKLFTKSKKYKAHNPEDLAKVGDKVVIEETRPMSKDKSWRIIQIEK